MIHILQSTYNTNYIESKYITSHKINRLKHKAHIQRSASPREKPVYITLIRNKEDNTLKMIKLLCSQVFKIYQIIFHHQLTIYQH